MRKKNYNQENIYEPAEEVEYYVDENTGEIVIEDINDDDGDDVGAVVNRPHYDENAPVGAVVNRPYDEDDAVYEGDDETVYEDDDDETIYEDDEYDYEYDEEDDEPGFFGRVANFFQNLSATEYLVGVTGIVTVALAVMMVLFLGKQDVKAEQLAAFADIGQQMPLASVIGGDGLMAMHEAQAAKQLAAEAAGPAAPDDMDEESLPLVYEEEKEQITVAMSLTSVLKDLKIKFANEKTKKLIPSVAFEVRVTDPGNKAATYTDENKDGIIHLDDIPGGTYKVEMLLTGAVKDFIIDTKAATISVKATAEYKKIDVADEIKTVAEINEAIEDNTVNNTPVEDVLADTVEWVDSSRVLVSETEFEEIKKSAIPEPTLGTSASPDPSPSPSEDPWPSPSPSEDPWPSPSPSEDPWPGPSEAPWPSPSPSEDPWPSPSTDAGPAAGAGSNGMGFAEQWFSDLLAGLSRNYFLTVWAEANSSPTPVPPQNDEATPLLNEKGAQVYVKQDSKYVKAVYADYFTAKKFYVRLAEPILVYKYTGWQTIDGQTYYYTKDGEAVTGEQVIKGAKYYFASDGALSQNTGQWGIDVSKWNGTINWNAVKNAGVNYVIIRCGYRGTATGVLVEDQSFHANIKGATAAGLKVGVYFFSQAINEREAIEEASMTLSLISGYRIAYPVFLDVEHSPNARANGISKEARTAVCAAFNKTVQNSGYTAGIYANKGWFESFINTRELTQWKIWLAQYNDAPTYTATRYDIWQYSSKGSVSGISGNVDMNLSYLGY
jgi:GH25 family lysozyme M1 (1,4-beta-N-acetylmuramidase)